MQENLRGSGVSDAVFPAAVSPILWHQHLLGERLHLNAWIRYAVVVAILAGSFFATHVVGVQDLDLMRIACCAAVLAVYNTIVLLLVRPYRRPEQAEGAYRLLVSLSHLTITADFLILTFLIWLVGGALSPFLAFYLLHVVMAAVLLSRRAAYAHTVFGYLLLVGLVAGEGLHWLPEHRPSGAVPAGGEIDTRYVLTVLAVYGLLMAGAAYLMTGLAGALRAEERKLRKVNAELDQLSRLRRAFLHIALHDMKAPVSAVSMLLNNLSSGLGGSLSEKQAHWIERAQQRLRDQLGFLRELQVLGELESGQEISAQARPVDLRALIAGLVDEHRDLAEQRKQVLRMEMPDALPAVHGVERLLREALANYVTNALKYSSEGSEVLVRATEGSGCVRVEVQDHGRGIALEDQAQLFQEFTRIQQKEGSGPPVAGTGLGLSIVRRIIEVHQGRLGVLSEVGKGSTFFVELPLSSLTGTGAG
jgi:signal transduction histidine kinase